MIAALKRLLARRARLKRLKRELSAQRFRQLADELTRLSLLAAQMDPAGGREEGGAARLRLEMQELLRMVDDPSFGRLSMNERRHIRQSLLQSRQAVLKALRSFDPPTQFRQ